MPRFTMRGMLIVVAVVALWLSTSVEYYGNYDVRYAIVLLAVVASGMKAYCSKGRPKCFWLAFSFVLLATVCYQGMLVPRVECLNYSLRPLVTSVDIYGNREMPGPGEQKVEFLAETIKLFADFFLASLAGFVGLNVYDHSRTANGN